MKSLRSVIGFSFSAFVVLWALLEPAGGFDGINDALSRNAVNYITLCAVSLAIGAVLSLARSGSKGKGEEVGAKRLDLDFPGSLAKAKREVIVLGISLPTFTSEGGLRVVGDLLKKDVRVDFVFVNPASPAILQRPGRLYEGYGKPPVVAADSLRACLRFREQLGAEAAENFHIHLTNALPTCAAVIVDETCFWHPYLCNFTGVNSPFLRGSASEGFSKHVVDHVRKVISHHSFEPRGCEYDDLTDETKRDSLAPRAFTAAEEQAIRASLSR